jgi:hypothetical protein
MPLDAIVIGRRRTAMSTTPSNVNTGQDVKQKGVQFPAELNLRDYFAAKAMQAIVADTASLKAAELGGKRFGFDVTAAVASAAYEFADAMLAAREA